jgi:hypothetical protein
MPNDEENLSVHHPVRSRNIHVVRRRIVQCVQIVLHIVAIGCVIALLVFAVAEILFRYVPFENYLSTFFTWAFILAIVREQVIYFFLPFVADTEKSSQ